LMLAIYILFSKYKDNRKLSFKIKPILVSVILVALGIYIFISGIKARGVKFDLLELRPDVNYNPNGWLPALSPFLALIIFRLYGYFGFGFFYVSKYITDVWFTSVRNLLLGILPM